MSDPVVKGAKRNTSRPAPQNASTKSSAKGGKVAATAAKPKAQRAAPEKAPARKVAPAQASRTAKTPAKSAAKKSPTPPPSKKAAAKPKAGPAKSVAAIKAGGTQKAAAKSQPKKPPVKSQPTKAPAAKSQPAKAAAKLPPPSKQPAAQASKQSKPVAAQAPAKTAAQAAPRPAPQPRQPSRDEAAALKAFERAHKEFARGNFTAARDLFRSLIVQHAGVSEVAARARTYLNIAEARLRSEAALPRDADALYDRGVFEMNRGDFVAAQEMFERALKRDPAAADTHYALAATRARLGAVETAIKALGQAVELSPKLRLRAQTDIDFITLRNEPEFERIVFAGPRG
jgi:hypothetical protein